VKHGMINAADLSLLHRTDSVDDAYSYIVSHLSGDALATPGPML
jgi:hypothetical protein